MAWPWMLARVAGSSMEPLLRDGDDVLVRRGRVAIGDVVVANHPERPGFLLVKRVTRQDSDGAWWLEGSNPAASHDSWLFGAIEPSAVLGRVVLRYRPGRPTIIGRDELRQS